MSTQARNLSIIPVINHHDIMYSSNVSAVTLQAAYHWFPEELVLGVVFAEHESRVALQRPGRLNLQHHLVVLQTPL